MVDVRLTAFEIWAKNEGYDIVKGDTKRDLGRKYRSHATMEAYKGWVAGKDELVRSCKAEL